MFSADATTERISCRFFFSCSLIRYGASTNGMAGGVLSTAAAPLTVRRRPAAARLVTTSTGCSRGAEAYRFGHVSRAARCLLACERWLETPGSSASMPRACGRARQARRSSERVFELAARDEPAWLVARRQPAQSGKVCRARAGRLGRDGALSSTMSTSSPIGSPAAGLRGAPLDGRLLPTLSTVSSASLLSLQPPPGAGAGRLASPALPTLTTRASARRPRRLRRARVARRSSGACSAGCAAQPDSLKN